MKIRREIKSERKKIKALEQSDNDNEERNYNKKN